MYFVKKNQVFGKKLFGLVYYNSVCQALMLTDQSSKSVWPRKRKIYAYIRMYIRPPIIMPSIISKLQNYRSMCG